MGETNLMAKRNRTAAEVKRAFMIMEATSANGGFPNYMNTIMSEMELEMQELGHLEPYKWTFSGGDGYAVPVVLYCQVT